MKNKIKMLIVAIAIVAINSCASIDVRVDKSQLKSETATEAIYPSSAVTPYLNPDAATVYIKDNLAKVNDSLRGGN